MTAENFRQISENVVALRELINNPVLAQAIVVLRDEQPKGDVSMNADAIESVRALSRQSGWSACIDLFLELALPLPPPPEQDTMPWEHVAQPK